MHPTILPESDYVSDRYPSTTPYNNREWLSQVREHGIEVPFETIITLDQGKSICTSCGAIYAGFQDRCTVPTRFVTVRPTNGYWRESFNSQTHCVGEVFRERHSVGYVESESLKDCGAWCKWDLSEDFDLQKSFFGMLELVASTFDTSPIKRWKNTMSPEKYVELELRWLGSNVFQLQRSMENCLDAIKVIAEKMNAAGNSLSF